MANEEWEGAPLRPLEKCARCGSTFGPGDEFVATLALGAKGMMREDRCTACADAAEARAIGFWRGRRQSGRGPQRLDFESLLELFLRLDGHAEPESARLRWIVAILLLRRRWLIQVERLRDEAGVETLVLKTKSDERLHRVVDPMLDDESFAQLRDELARIFNFEPKPQA